MASIPEILLEYTENNIIINSKCFLNHCISLPLDKFLIKFHPLYIFFKDFYYCSKCFIKLFHYNKSSFFTHYCSICNEYYCIHCQNLDEKHKNNLKIIEKEIPKINFNFPICPECINKKDDLTIINGKIKQSTLKEIIQNFNKKIKFLKILENDFNNLKGKIYFELYPFYEYFMRMNFLEILLCENLIKTYKLYKEKKNFYIQIIKNILNIFSFIDDLFSLKNIKGTKEEIKEIKNYFMNLNNCFLLPKKNSNPYQIVVSKEYIKKLIPFLNLYLYDKNPIKKDFTGKLIIYPEINKIFEITDRTIIYELNNISDYKIIKHVPENISYIKNNLFIYQISNKLYIDYLNKNKILISKGIITLENNKDYKSIYTGKKNILFCFGYQLNDQDNLNNDFDEKIFIDNIVLNEFSLEILRCSDDLTEAKTISTINDIDFIIKINNNLFLYKKNESLFFLDGEGKEIKEIKLPEQIYQKQISIYKENYLIIMFKNIFWFFDLIKIQLIYSNSFNNILQISFSLFKNKDIVDENNDVKPLYSIYQNKLNINYHDNFKNYFSINIGLFFKHDGFTKFITNFEEKDNIICQNLCIKIKGLKEIIFLKNENMLMLIYKKNVVYYKYD